MNFISMEMPLPPKKEQSEIIHRLINTTSLRIGVPAHIISVKWFDKWKESVGYSNGIMREIEITEIENHFLLLDNGKLKENVREGIDFEIVTKEVWDQLQKWYNFDVDISISTEFDQNKKIIVDLWIPTFQVYYVNERRPLKYSIYHNIGDFKNTICEIFTCNPEKTRLCDFHSRERNITLDEHKIFADYPIFRTGESTYELLLETQKDDGRWITVKHTKNRSQLMSKSPSMQTIIENNAEPGVCGFTNIGNSCYLNAALQSIVHIPNVIDYFLKNKKWKNDINYQNPLGTQGNIVNCFCELLNDVWNGSNSKISPRALKSIVGEYVKHFSGQSQQDAHEFMVTLLDKIHEDLNKAQSTENQEKESIFSDDTNDDEAAEASWKRYKEINDSFIVDNFHGMLRSHLFCPNCQKTTIVFNSFMSLTVPLPIPKEQSIPFIFIPYDITKPRIKLQVSTIKPPSVLEYCEAISQKTHQNVIDLMFTERHENSTENLRWRTSIPTVESMKNKQPIAQSCTSFAYEIPHNSEDGIFICVRLISFKKVVFVEQKILPFEIEGIFLIELEKENPTEEEIIKGCENKFKYLFQPTKSPLNDELKKLKDISCENPQFIFNDDEKFKIFKLLPVEKERHSRLTTGIIDIIVNPKILKDENMFNWNLIRNNQTIENQDVNEDNKQKKKITLEDCIDMFSKEDILDSNNQWLCPHCKQFVCARKKMEIWEPPNVLIIHLKKFLHVASGNIKLDVDVKYPNIIDLNDKIIGPKDDVDYKYRLQSIIEHSGDLNNGHYISRVFHNDLKRWYIFNDEVVKQINSKSVHSRDAYVLIYTKMSTNKIKRKPMKIQTRESTSIESKTFIPIIRIPFINIPDIQNRMKSQEFTTENKYYNNVNENNNELSVQEQKNFILKNILNNN